MTPFRSDPPRTPAPPRYHGPTPWPEGFRGIGGHLIRPRDPKPVPPIPPTPYPSPTNLAEIAPHGTHLLAPIVPGADGSRTAACPVCLTGVALPPSGGWVPVRCSACGTEFVATDGSPPPAPSPIAPTMPLDPRPPEADLPRGFTSDVRTTPDGRRRVTCPQCRSAEVEVPRSATVAIVLRCPVCSGPFLVGLEEPPARSPAPSVPPPPVPPPIPPAEDDTEEPLTDPPPTLWERIRKWFSGE